MTSRKTAFSLFLTWVRSSFSFPEPSSFWSASEIDPRRWPERSKLWEREWSPELKEIIKEFTAMWGWNSRIFFFYFIILPHRWNYCGGEISEKPSLWGIEISPNFWLKQMKIAGIIPPVHENCWGTSKRFEELQEIIEMNNKYLLALIESSKKTGSP